MRRNPDDSFAEPEEFVARMDELGIATVLLPTGDIGRHGTLDPYDFEHIAARWEEVEKLAARWPGRFAALALIDPEHGMRGCRDMRAHLADPWVVGCYLHTHSFDRRLDHADYYPFYAACADAGVPVQMQAGTSGGLMASECARPITIDRAALYFHDTKFVLSHLGVPWVDEATALALKFPNVYLGTGALPPRHWPPAVLQFLRGPGRRQGRCSPATSRPSATATRSTRSPSSSLTAGDRAGVARRHRTFGVHPPCGRSQRMSEPMVGKVYGIPPQPPVEENTRTFRAGAVTFGVEYRDLDPEGLEETLQGQPAVSRRAAREVTGGRVLRRGRHRSTCSTPATGTSTCVSTCSTTSRTTTTSTAPSTTPSSTT